MRSLGRTAGKIRHVGSDGSGTGRAAVCSMARDGAAEALAAGVPALHGQVGKKAAATLA